MNSTIEIDDAHFVANARNILRPPISTRTSYVAKVPVCFAKHQILEFESGIVAPDFNSLVLGVTVSETWYILGWEMNVVSQKMMSQ